MTLSQRIAALEGPDRAIVCRLVEAGECWEWSGPTDKRGRGRLWRGGKIMIHHRAVWEILVGPIPKGALLCHHCDNPKCANPNHLYVGDGKTNVRDMFERGRHWTQREPARARDVARRTGTSNTWTRGEKNPKAKLSLIEVSFIAGSDLPTKVLAEKYCVNRTTIQRIRRGALWQSSDEVALKARGL